MFDAVFVPDLDRDTLDDRLAARPDDEFGSKPHERALVLRLHAIKEDIPTGVRINAQAPLSRVVDEILSKCKVTA